MRRTKIILAITSIISTLGFSKAMACKENAISHSKRMIETVLDDIMKTYKMTGGGGISEIKMISTNTYQITILQEEAPHVFTYEMDTQANCKIKITKKTETTSLNKKQ